MDDAVRKSCEYDLLHLVYLLDILELGGDVFLGSQSVEPLETLSAASTAAAPPLPLLTPSSPDDEKVVSGMPNSSSCRSKSEI